MDVITGNAVIPTVARAVTLPIQALNPLVPGDGVVTLPLAVMPEPVRKASASDHHTQAGADRGAAGRASAFAAANAAAKQQNGSRSSSPSTAAEVVLPDTSTTASRRRGFNLYA